MLAFSLMQSPLGRTQVVLLSRVQLFLAQLARQIQTWSVSPSQVDLPSWTLVGQHEMISLQIFWLIPQGLLQQVLVEAMQQKLMLLQLQSHSA